MAEKSADEVEKIYTSHDYSFLITTTVCNSLTYLDGIYLVIMGNGTEIEHNITLHILTLN